MPTNFFSSNSNWHTPKKTMENVIPMLKRKENQTQKSEPSKFKTSNFEGELNLSLILAFARCNSHKEST
jgi:hypothetical protein